MNTITLPRETWRAVIAVLRTSGLRSKMEHADHIERRLEQHAGSLAFVTGPHNASKVLSGTPYACVVRECFAGSGADSPLVRRMSIGIGVVEHSSTPPDPTVESEAALGPKRRRRE